MALKNIGSGFGSSKRLGGAASKSFADMPGPGAYTIDPDSITGPKYGFGT